MVAREATSTEQRREIQRAVPSSTIGAAMVASGRYPRSYFRLVMGTNRRVYRVGAYTGLKSEPTRRSTLARIGSVMG